MIEDTLLAIEALTGLGDASAFTTPEELIQVREWMVASAKVPEGYLGLTWDVCARLIQQGMAQDPGFCTAVSESILAAVTGALDRKEWYRALGFMDLVWDDASWATHPLHLIQTSGRLPKSTDANAWVVDPDTLRLLSGAEHHRLALFLAGASLIGMPAIARYQAAAAILRVLAPNSADFVLVAKAFLDGLIAFGYSGLAFVAWWHLASISEPMSEEVAYLSFFKDYMDAGIKDGVEILELIRPFAADEHILRLAEVTHEWRVVMFCLAYLGHTISGDDHYTALLYRTLPAVTPTCPGLTRLLRSIDDSDHEETTRLADKLNRTLELLDELIEQRRTYRGVALALRIWRHNLELHFFAAAVAARQLRANPDEWLTRLRALDSRVLVDSCPDQNASPHPIEGGLLVDLVGDIQEVIDALIAVFELRQAHPQVDHRAKASEDMTSGDLLSELELARLESLGPTVAWVVQRLLRPNCSTMESASEDRRAH